MEELALSDAHSSLLVNRARGWKVISSMQHDVPRVVGEKMVSQKGGHLRGIKGEGTIWLVQGSNGTRFEAMPPFCDIPDAT